jgi:hypothetical protein
LTRRDNKGSANAPLYTTGGKPGNRQLRWKNPSKSAQNRKLGAHTET